MILWVHVKTFIGIPKLKERVRKIEKEKNE